MNIKRVGKVLPGYHTDTFSDEIVNSLEFNNLCVYTLPQRLLELIHEQQPNLFSSEQLEKERQLAQLPMTVVFDKGTAKTAKLLQLYDASIDETQFKEMFGEGSYRAVVKVLDGDLRKIDLIGKAYCGWLVQQREYQADIQAFRKSMEDRENVTQDCQACHDGNTSSNSFEIRESICKKWRLASLVTSEIPEPLLPHLSAINFYSRDIPEGAVLPFIPDTFPIQGTGLVVDQLNNSRLASGAAHLADWWNLTSNGTGNTRPFELFARQFQLQHYWRVLRTRFQTETDRKQQVFSYIFAAYFGVSQDSIRRDFQQLKKKSDLLRKPIERRF